MYNFRCPICESNDQWENVDEHRYKPHDMCICKKCSFITYPKVNKEELKKYYEKDYRHPPTSPLLHSGNLKLHYHNYFLKDHFDDFNKKEEFNVCDVGAAYGIFLDWFKRIVPKSNLYGTELTLSYRRNAYHEFGINLTKEIDASIKYDLISLYHVAEHLTDIDLELKKYNFLLKEDGILYIAVPVWFEHINNGTEKDNDLEYMYHKDHVNVWSRELFESLLFKCGFEIIKSNHIIYGSTYLCKKGKFKKVDSHIDYKNIIEKMKLIKESNKAFMDQNFEKAFNLWPNFPAAYQNYYEMNRKKFHELGFEKIEELLNKALSNCSTNGKVELFAADIYMRYEKYEEAIKILDSFLEKIPNNVTALVALSQCFRLIAENEKNNENKIKLLKRSRDILRFTKTCTLQGHDELYNWMYRDNANIPSPKE